MTKLQNPVSFKGIFKNGPSGSQYTEKTDRRKLDFFFLKAINLPKTTSTRFFLYLYQGKCYWREMEKLGKNRRDSVEDQFSFYYKNTSLVIEKGALNCHGGATFTHLTLA